MRTATLRGRLQSTPPTVDMQRMDLTEPTTVLARNDLENPASDHGPVDTQELSGVVESDSAPATAGSGNRQLARMRIWAAAAAMAILALLSGQALATTALGLALCLMITSAVVPGSGPARWGVIATLPAGFVLLCSWSLLWGLAGGASGLAAWGSRGPALVGMLLLGLLTGQTARHRGGSVELIGRDLPAFLGFTALLAFFGFVVATQPLALWSRVNSSGTDFLRHLGAVRAVRESGGLEPGQAGYPESLHAIGAWLTAAQGTGTSADSLWRSIAPLGFLMLGLVLIAIMVVARRAADITLGGRLPGIAASMVGAVAFLQTAWFSTFLAFGNVMNMMVGVSLMALLTEGLRPRTFGSTAGTVVAAAAISVTANAWQLLLPVVGLAGIPWFAGFLIRGRHRWQDWAVWAVAGVLVLNGLAGLFRLDGTSQASMATVSDLFRPDWWWWAALALALLTVGSAWLRGAVAWSLVAAAILVGSMVLVGGLLLWTGSTWELMRYYPAKALWTAIVAVVPLAATGGILLVVGAWRLSQRRAGWSAPVLRGLVVVVVGVVAAGVLGRGAAFRPHLLSIAEGRSGMPTWSLALLDAVGDLEIDDEARDGAIIFGIVPSADVGGVAGGFVGMVDFMAMDALSHANLEGAATAPVKAALYRRDMTQVCRYLKDFPESLRMTGPNPAAGAPWIVESGCPEDIVRPDRWISLDIEPVWLERSPWENGIWSYPTFDQFRMAFLEG